MFVTAKVTIARRMCWKKFTAKLYNKLHHKLKKVDILHRPGAAENTKKAHQKAIFILEIPYRYGAHISFAAFINSKKILDFMNPPKKIFQPDLNLKIGYNANEPQTL